MADVMGTKLDFTNLLSAVRLLHFTSLCLRQFHCIHFPYKAGSEVEAYSESGLERGVSLDAHTCYGAKEVPSYGLEDFKHTRVYVCMYVCNDSSSKLRDEISMRSDEPVAINTMQCTQVPCLPATLNSLRNRPIPLIPSCPF